MKSILTLITGLLLPAATAFAQPTLTAATSTPVPGLSYQVYSNTAHNPGPAGAAQTWDFSALPFNGPVNYSCGGCGAPGTSCATFPGSKLVQHSNGPQVYYSTGASGISINGFASNTASGNLVYGNGEDVLRFPFTYNNAFTDSFTANIVNAGTPFFRRGIDTVTADGWGTLITPAGTFTDVLRTKQISTYRDSGNFNGNPVNISYRSVSYSWRDVAHKEILFGASTITTNSSLTGSSSSTSSFYTANQTTVAVAEFAEALDLTVFPNPASGFVSCRFMLKDAADVTVSMTDLTGRVVKTISMGQLQAGEQLWQIPIDGLSAGGYLLRVEAGAASAVRRVMVGE